MFEVLSLKQKTFGLDINDLSLKIVQLKKKRNGFELLSFNEARIPENVIECGVIKNESALARIIKHTCQTAEGKKIDTKYAVISVPEEKSFSQVIQMPKMSENELRLAVSVEAENYIPMSIEDVYIDFKVIAPLKDYINRLEVLIVATPKKIIDSYVSCIKKAGFIPLVLEPESEATSRALVKKEKNSSMQVLVDFGENNTEFIVFSGQSVRFTCSIPVSSMLLTKAIATSLKIGYHEAEKFKIEYGLLGVAKKKSKAEKVSQAIIPIVDDLAGQIKKYLDFYRDHSSYEYLLPGGKSEKILFCGGGARLKGLTDFMSKNLGAKVELANPLVNFMPGKSKNMFKKDRDALSFTTAIGLALRQIENNCDCSL